MLKDGTLILGGVSEIINHLTKKYSIQIDSKLSDRQNAEKKSISALVETKLYYAMVQKSFFLIFFNISLKKKKKIV